MTHALSWRGGSTASRDATWHAHGLHRIERSGAQRRRARYSARLRAAATAAGLTVQHVPAGVTPNCQNLPILCAPRDRERVIDLLAAGGVEGRKYFSPALHTLDRSAEFGPLPVTDDVASRVLCLPLWDRMADVDLDVECAALLATRVAERCSVHA